MNILITGAAGGIGSTLGYDLYKKGHNLFLIDNFSGGYKENLIINKKTYGTFYETDIRDTKKLEEIIRENDVTHIIHLAAITALPVCEENPLECISVNVNGTLSVLTAARNTGVKRVVFSSTSAVYESNDDTTIFTEDDEINPRLFYSLSKKLAEEICTSFVENYDMEIPILRYFNVFGPRQDIYRKSPPLINYLVRELLNGRQPILHSDGKQLRDYIYVQDVCKITELALTHNTAKDGIWNVCSGELISLNEIVDIVTTTLNTNIQPMFREPTHFWDNYPSLFEGKYPLKKSIVHKEVIRTCAGSNEKSKRLLNWDLETNIKQAISNTVLEIKQSNTIG